MDSPVRAYLSGAVGSFAARALSVCAGVLSLWFLTRILSADDFSGYAAAMAVVLLVGLNAGMGIERAMLLRISEHDPGGKRLIGGGMMMRTLLVTLLMSGVVVALILLAVGERTDTTTKWIIWLWPAIPLTAAGGVLSAWYQSNHRVGLFQLMPGVQDAARCAAFAVVFVAGFGAVAVAAGAIVAAILPIALFALLAIRRTNLAPASLSAKDGAAGLQFLAMRVSFMGLRQLDLVFMGFLVGGVETAAYAVASRLGDVASMGKSAFSGTYAPRARRHIKAGDTGALRREYAASRALGFLITLAIAAIILILGPWLIDVFGGFEGAFVPLVLIVAGHSVAAGVGAQNAHLSVSGNLHLATINRLITLALFIALLAVLVPLYSGVGAAAAFLIAATLHEVSGALLVRRMDGIRAIPPAAAAALLLTAIALVSVAAGVSPIWASVVALAVAAAITIATERDGLQRALAPLFGRRQL